MKAAHFFEVKAVVAMITGIAAFLFDPTQSMALLALFVLVLVDFVFGVAASKKTGMQITSAKFFRTPFKIGIYFALIAACHVAEFTLPAQMGFLDETLIGFLAATELVSILEKAGYMGYAIPRKLLNQLQKYTGEENERM